MWTSIKIEVEYGNGNNMQSLSKLSACSGSDSAGNAATRTSTDGYSLSNLLDFLDGKSLNEISWLHQTLIR